MCGYDKIAALSTRRTMDKFDRYLKLVIWLQKRYTVNDQLLKSIGGKPSRYTQLEQLAFERLLG